MKAKGVGNRITIPTFVEAADGYSLDVKDDGTLIYSPVWLK